MFTLRFVNTWIPIIAQRFRFIKARQVKGIKKILIASGVRYDLAIEDPRYIKELATHHVGGYLKIAPEHTEEGPLSRMMKPGMGTYDKFKELFDKYSKEAGKKQYLIPYFISAHPGTTDKDMINLAIWLKSQNFKLNQVQNFYPSPMANATTIYHTEMNSLRNIKNNQDEVPVPKGARQRRLHKAILRYHDPSGWPIIREALRKLGMANLIGKAPQHLVPPESRDEKRSSGKAGGKYQNNKHNASNRGDCPALSRHTGSSQFNKANTKPRVGDNKKRK